jgi:hypothetical protein
MVMMHKLLGVLIISMLLFSCRKDSDKEEVCFPELNMAKGDRFSMKMEIEQDLESESNGAPIFIEQYFTFDILSEVDSVSADAQSYVLSNMYQRISMHQQITSETDTTVYFLDTDDPSYAEVPSARLLDYYKKLLQLPYTSLLDRQGNLQSTNLHDVNVTAGGQEYSSPYQHLFTYGVVFPGYKLKLHDIWEKEINYHDSTILIDGLLTYRLESFDKERALVSMSGKFRSAGKGMSSATKMTLEQSGEIWIYLNSGWISEANIEQKIQYTTAGQGRTQNISGNIRLVGRQEP